MKKFLLFALVAVCVFSLAGNSYARGGRNICKRKAMMFERIDSDNNGIITFTEAKNFHKNKFNKQDVDSNGYLTMDEFLSHPMGNKERMRQRAKKMFSKLDADNDGKLSKAEFEAKFDKRFSRLDDDGDGNISKAEFMKRRNGKPCIY